MKEGNMKIVTPQDRGFIEGPPDRYGESKIVNLDQVSNIGFDTGTDRFNNPKFKIIFNMVYGVSLKNNTDKQIPDYVYFVYDNPEEYQDKIDKLNAQINHAKWFAPLIGDKVDMIINPNYISFISTDRSKNRIITNLSCSVSFYNDYQRKTSDFIFLDFNTLDEMETELI